MIFDVVDTLFRGKDVIVKDLKQRDIPNRIDSTAIRMGKKRPNDDGQHSVGTS